MTLEKAIQKVVRQWYSDWDRYKGDSNLPPEHIQTLLAHLSTQGITLNLMNGVWSNDDWGR